MVTANIYLNFNGNCEEAFNFYKSVFGGEFCYFSRFNQMPQDEADNLIESDKNKVLHVALPIGNTVIMGSDCRRDQAEYFVQGNNFSISITAESKDETDKLFNELLQGGEIIMPLTHTFWGDYFGMLTDKFGINWMVSFPEQEQV
jgi:PhnB protein